MTTEEDIDREEETDSKNEENDIDNHIQTESPNTDTVIPQTESSNMDTATTQTELSNTDATTARYTNFIMGLHVEPLRRAYLVSIEDSSLPEAHLVVDADPADKLKRKISNTNILVVVIFILIICSVSIPLALVLTKKNVGKHDPPTQMYHFEKKPTSYIIEHDNKQDIDGEEETDSKNIEEDIGSNILTESSHTDTATHQTESSNTDAATAGCTLNLPVEPLRRASLVSIEDISLPEAHLVVHADPVNNLKKKTSNTNILIVVTFILIICSVSIPLALVLTKKNVGKHDPDVPDIQKYAELRKIIAPISGGDDIFDHQSPMASADRIAALDWMMNDTFTLSLMTLDTEWKIIQRYIIALIYFSTQGQHWYDQYSFLSGLDVCSWINAWREDEGFFKEEINAKGIICNERGRVTELRLYWNNLSGTFPYEISHLNETLSTINLNGGSISSSIPKTFGNLGKLKLLGLAENCLSGTVPIV
eukprot:CAMPEP_0184872288 /NCGR_PEP_ID=MMETSP0580-20130426/41199_1 /TAXON_ID=1118495 /ORGANISM="Dactyliosolen fragilissimus" /LENGTH=478 /DNA_ID=CAMNT_0027375057 /DNA_START=77 /DNA_END=1515 /DNA_ORIENTATION=-